MMALTHPAQWQSGALRVQRAQETLQRRHPPYLRSLSRHNTWGSCAHTRRATTKCIHIRGGNKGNKNVGGRLLEQLTSKKQQKDVPVAAIEPRPESKRATARVHLRVSGRTCVYKQTRRVASYELCADVCASQVKYVEPGSRSILSAPSPSDPARTRGIRATAQDRNEQRARVRSLCQRWLSACGRLPSRQQRRQRQRSG